MGSHFDPLTQNITMHDAAGNPFNVSLPVLDAFVQYDVRICINYGCQLGASVIILIVLLLLTKSEKRKSVVFILNLVALVNNIIRLFCECMYFTSQFNEVFVYFTLDVSSVPTSAYANSIVAVIFVLFVLVSVEASLIFQVNLLCTTLRRRYRHALLYLSLLVAILPVGIRAAFMVENCKAIMNATIPPHWLESASNIAITVSICFFCSIFVAKLGIAIRQRKRLGLTELGPMKVIFVMGCQTLFIPAFFSVLTYAIYVPELSSNVITLVVISLPLSSVWAAAAVDHRRASTYSSGQNLYDKLSFTSTAKHVSNLSSVGPQAQCICERAVSRDPSDLEYAHGISVERDISVRSYRKGSDA